MTILYQSPHNRKCQRTERSIPINETNYTYLTRRIGNTNYRVKVCFSEDAEETLEDTARAAEDAADGAMKRFTQAAGEIAERASRY